MAGTSESVDGSKTVTGKPVSLVRDVRGSCEMQPELFQELMNYVGSSFRAVGDSFGIYLMDPDAAKQGALCWEVGVRISPGKPLSRLWELNADNYVFGEIFSRA